MEHSNVSNENTNRVNRAFVGLIHSQSPKVTLVVICLFIAGFSVTALLHAMSTFVLISPLAGVCLAMALIYGRKALPGFMIAFVLTFATTLYLSSVVPQTPGSPRLFLLICGGNLLMGYTGALLLAKYIEYPLRLVTGESILKFLFVCIGVSQIPVILQLSYYSDIAIAQDRLTYRLMMVTSNAIGVLVFTPMLMSLLATPKEIWRERRSSVLLPSLLTFFVLVAFGQLFNTLQHDTWQMEFEKQADYANDEIKRNLLRQIEHSENVANYVNTTGILNADQFSSFSSRFMGPRPEIVAISLHPLITRQNRTYYENNILPKYSIHKTIIHRNEDGKDIPAGVQENFYPITFKEPPSPELIGLDLSNTGYWKIPGEGRVALSEPMTFTSLSEHEMFLNVVAKFDRAQVGNGQDFIDNGKGGVTVLLNVNRLIEHSLKNSNAENIFLTLSHISTNKTRKLVYSNYPDPMPDNTNDISYTSIFYVSGQTWEINYLPADDFTQVYAEQYGAMITLAIFIIVILLAGTLLSASGRRIRTDQIVEERTEEIRNQIAVRQLVEENLVQSNKVLESIYHGLSELITGKDQAEIFRFLLDKFLELTGSEYGIISEFPYYEDQPKFKILSHSDKPWFRDFNARAKKTDGTFYSSDRVFARVLRSKKYFISNNNSDEYNQSLVPKGHPKFDNLLAIPFTHNDKVAGIIALFNKEGGYSSEDVDFLNPLLLTSGAIVKNFQDQEIRLKTESNLQKVSRAVEQTPTMILITDECARFEYCNPVFEEKTGYKYDEIKGKTALFLASDSMSDSEKNMLREEVWECISKGEIWRGEVHCKIKSGESIWTQQSMAPVFNDNNKITNFINIIEDITERKNLTEQLTYQASHDRLTGLYNRHELENRLALLLSSLTDEKETHALCFMDLDQFKFVNDTCGHIAGDELLRQLTDVIRSKLRKTDTLARLGGDEFALIINSCSLGKAEQIANKILQAVMNFKFAWEDKSFPLGISIGIVPITHMNKNITQLLQFADAACYVAKDSGRNRIHVYNNEDDLLLQQSGEMDWVNKISEALENDRFILFAQPIVPINNGENMLSHMELLLRMKGDNNEVIMPGSFMSTAERYNLMPKIDIWVVDYAFKWMGQFEHQHECLPVCSINLSGHSLGDQKVLDYIIEKIEQLKIPPYHVCFEVTETAAISNLTFARRFIKELKARGCQFALDDFGSGLSSFGYLKNFPIDYLKIDGMFVKDICKDPIDMAMVKSINEIGQVMGKQTIAEFVESNDILNKLREIGVDYAQGYAVGRPVPLEDFYKDIIPVETRKKAALA